MKFVPYFLYLWLIGFHIVIGRDVSSIYGVSINLTALVVVLVAYYKSEVVAAWFGLLAGLLVGCSEPGMMGWTGLIFAAVGLTAYHVKERLNLDAMFARVLMILGGVLTAELLTGLESGTSGFGYRLLTEMIPGAVYTTIIGWLFFLNKDGRLTYQKAKSIF